jgi:hypothetical protein
VALPNRDPGEPVHPRGQPQPGLETLGGQPAQQRGLDREVLPDGAHAGLDPASVIGGVDDLDPFVELREGVHHRCVD